MYIYIRTLYISDETRIQMKRKREKKRKDRSCILQPRSNGIPDLCSHTSRKPDPYRTSAICHTAPEQTSFRSSINHFFFSLSCSFIFLFFLLITVKSTRSCCLLPERSRIERTHRLFSPPRNWRILLSMHYRDSRGPGGSDA